jgi:hypothetical protein
MFLGRLDNGGKLSIVEAGSTDQQAVDTLDAEVDLGAIGVNTAAVEDLHRLASGLAIETLNEVTDSGHDGDDVLGFSKVTGSNGPDGLVGDDDVLDLGSGVDSREGCRRHKEWV